MFFARGSGGQILAINPQEKVVIAKWAVWDNPPNQPSGAAAQNEDQVFFAALINKLHRERSGGRDRNSAVSRVDATGPGL